MLLKLVEEVLNVLALARVSPRSKSHQAFEVASEMTPGGETCDGRDLRAGPLL
jgi:hypothetical protein